MKDSAVATSTATVIESCPILLIRAIVDFIGEGVAGCGAQSEKKLESFDCFYASPSSKVRDGRAGNDEYTIFLLLLSPDESISINRSLRLQIQALVDLSSFPVIPGRFLPCFFMRRRVFVLKIEFASPHGEAGMKF